MPENDAQPHFFSIFRYDRFAFLSFIWASGSTSERNSNTSFLLTVGKRGHERKMIIFFSRIAQKCIKVGADGSGFLIRFRFVHSRSTPLMANTIKKKQRIVDGRRWGFKRIRTCCLAHNFPSYIIYLLFVVLFFSVLFLTIWNVLWTMRFHAH